MAITDIDALERRLDELAAGLSDDDDPKTRAEVVLLIAQTRTELLQATETQKRMQQPWWMGRQSELLVGVIVAAALVTAYMVENLLPLLGADEQLALKLATIAENDAKIQEQITTLTMQENERVRNELALNREELSRATQEFAAQLSKREQERQDERAELNRQLLAAQSLGEEANQLKAKLARVETELQNTQETRRQIDATADQLRINANAYYRLTTQAHPSFSLTMSGKQLNLSSSHDSPGEGTWKFTPTGGGYYRVTTRSLGPGFSLDIVNDGRSNNRTTIARTGNYSGQYWKVHPIGDGYYRLTTMWRKEGLSLEASEGEPGDFTVTLEPSREAASQFWRLELAKMQS